MFNVPYPVQTDQNFLIGLLRLMEFSYWFICDKYTF